MIRFKVNLKGIDKGQDETIKRTKMVLMKSMFKMEELAVQNAPVDRGELRQRITLFPQILAERYELYSLSQHLCPLQWQ